MRGRAEAICHLQMSRASVSLRCAYRTVHVAVVGPCWEEMASAVRRNYFVGVNEQHQAPARAASGAPLGRQRPHRPAAGIPTWHFQFHFACADTPTRNSNTSLITVHTSATEEFSNYIDR